MKNDILLPRMPPRMPPLKYFLFFFKINFFFINENRLGKNLTWGGRTRKMGYYNQN